MDELQYSMRDDLRFPSEDTFSVSPTLKPRVLQHVASDN